eukprot:c19449_g1_i1 orf=136-681(+)
MALLHLQLWLPAFLCIISLLSHCLATVYTVGGPAGWTTPSRAKVNYTEWAANTPFKVGDSLEFNYVYKAHTVLEVIRSDYRYCNKTSPILSFDATTGKTVVELSKPGNYYFIDGVGEHCAEGQKFQAKVSGVLAEAPSSDQPSASPTIPPATAAASTLSSTSILIMLSASFIVLMLSVQFH